MREDFIIRHLWELHKSPRSQMNYLMGSPRDYSVFNKMVEEGSLVQDFRFRGFPKRSMEKPTLPVTVPYSEDRVPADNTMPVWVRSHRYLAGGGGDGLLYGERRVDNAPKARGFRNPPHDPEVETYIESREDTEGDRHRRELLQDLRREKERSQRGSTQDRRRWNQNGIDPDIPLYQPSFGQQESQRQSGREAQDSRGGGSPTRRGQWGIPVTEFLKHDEFEDRSTFRQGPADGNLNTRGEATTSPRRDIRGIPVTDFIREDKIDSPRSQRQADMEPITSRGGGSPARGEKWGIPVTEFIKHDEFEGDLLQGGSPGQPGPDLSPSGPAPQPPNTRPPPRGIPVTQFIKRDEMEGSRGRERTPGRRFRLPEEPVYDPFGRAGGGAPVVDSSGRTKTSVFGNFEKRSDPREAEQAFMAKKMMKDDFSRSIQEQRTRREEDNQYFREPDANLADLMRKTEVGKPRVDPQTGVLSSHPLPTSDVSRLKMNYQPRDGKETVEYRKFLQQQMEDRERSRQQERLRQRDEADKHFQIFDSQWGHMGGGAPTDIREHRKLKLEDSLHRSRDFTSDPYSEEDIRQSPGGATHRYVKNTIHSTSKQHYQLSPDGPYRNWVNPSYHKMYFEEDLREMPADVTPRYVKNTIQSTSRTFYRHPSARLAPPYHSTKPPFAVSYHNGY